MIDKTLADMTTEHRVLDLSYITEKIQAAPVFEEPFRHVEINDLFEPEDFALLVESSDIRIPRAQDDEALFATLFEQQYKVITFPGCTSNYREYLDWHQHKAASEKVNKLCEGYGVVMRLEQPQTDAVRQLQEFLYAPALLAAMADKFNIQVSGCNYDAGIQKYFDGYEISPHPDTRRKALTYMVNINPDPDSEHVNHHTNYLAFNPDWQFVPEFWDAHPEVDRCWVPWDWCSVKKQQRKNNSMVIFAPDNRTIHAVKADYDHLSFQRTQLYGNFWIKGWKRNKHQEWYDFLNPDEAQAVRAQYKKTRPGILSRMKRALRIGGKDGHIKRKY